MCNVVEVDRKAKTVMFQDGFWSMMIYDGKIIAQNGSYSPVELRKCMRKYFAIFPEKDPTPEEIRKERDDNYEDDIATGLDHNQ